MNGAAFAPPRTAGADGGEYRPGVCNIGPAEIRRRRRAGHLGLLSTVGVWAVLVAIDAPRLVRVVLVGLPAAGSAAGYLQAWLEFCAAFGARGVFNFGDPGRTEKVADADARAADRARANRIGLASLGIGVALGLAAALLPRTPTSAS